ncbi:mediator of RNA polymerase II transcription subunit 15-like isoform X2 [Tachypleus tridentatus]|uniref:mediator of RNA polymerase II transcription subunit 15-like isoform X2 n=1 Tax=Tachypleus tridentatus TaxID=6853 RepID=UPI003FD684C2
MADSSQDQSWRNDSYRQNVRARIEDAVQQAGNPTNKSVVELENHIFQKANTREEYLEYVARVMLHVRDMNPKKAAQKGLQPGQAMPSGAGGPGGQDPMLALKTLAGPGTGQNQPQVTQLGIQVLGGAGSGQGQPQLAMSQPGLAGSSAPNVVANSIPQQGLNPMVVTPSGRWPLGNLMTSQQQNQRPLLNPNMQLHLQKLRQQQQQQQAQSAQVSSQGSTGSQSAVPSPANQHPSSVASSQMVASPAGYTPSPSSQIVPSPVSSMIGRTPGTVGVASPGSALNTPANLGSNASPASRTSQDDQAYLEKLKQLSKYREPLRRMIARIDKDENRKKELSKLKNLLDILSDSNKRCPMETLLKCEHVLEKLELKEQANEASAQPQPSLTKPQEQNIFQPLLDALSHHIKLPLFSHTLQRTFGPAVSILAGPTTSLYCTDRFPSPPPKKKKMEEEGTDILQGEIARLDQRFKVQLDPVQHSGSRTVHLICQLDDKNLPCVPPIMITVPETYPDTPPLCNAHKPEYESTPFLQTIQKNLTLRLSNMSEKFSVTSLLDMWEMSVRQACSPRTAVAV